MRWFNSAVNRRHVICDGRRCGRCRDRRHASPFVPDGGAAQIAFDQSTFLVRGCSGSRLGKNQRAAGPYQTTRFDRCRAAAPTAPPTSGWHGELHGYGCAIPSSGWISALDRGNGGICSTSEVYASHEAHEPERRLASVTASMHSASFPPLSKPRARSRAADASALLAAPDMRPLWAWSAAVGWPVV